MTEPVTIEIVTEVTDELAVALAHLLPQLSKSAPALTTSTLHDIVDSPTSTLLVARGSSSIIGTLTVAVFRVPSGMRAWIEDVIVDESWRGLSVGEQLVQAAVALSLNLGARTVDLTSRPDREAANRLYLRLGFERRETNVYRYSLDG